MCWTEWNQLSCGKSINCDFLSVSKQTHARRNEAVLILVFANAHYVIEITALSVYENHLLQECLVKEEREKTKTATFNESETDALLVLPIESNDGICVNSWVVSAEHAMKQTMTTSDFRGKFEMDLIAAFAW